MNIFVTGGTGYIGSHTCVQLLEAGHDVVIMDNLSNSKADTVDKIQHITGKKVKFYQSDMLDIDSIRKIFSENRFDSVIHFAGLKAVGESVQEPLLYYNNNITGTLNLCKIMQEYGCKNIVFSSSATVYKESQILPLVEDFPLGTTNPYGSTKLFIEQILQDLYISDNSWNVTLLRYFNPVGAHDSGMIGEDPNGIPNNLMPYIIKVASKQLPHLNVFGNDYPTHDGTGVRDYIHVVDLAIGHLKALSKMNGVCIYNLGTGKGYSVLDIVKAFEKANGVEIPYKIAPRRPGDIAECYANAKKAKTELGWTAARGIEDMCKSGWNFCLANMKG